VIELANEVPPFPTHRSLLAPRGVPVNYATKGQARWSKEARDLIREYVEQQGAQSDKDMASAYRQLSDLVTRLVNLTGHSREMCLRFARQFGVKAKRTHRAWTTTEQQRLLDLIVTNPPREVARILDRSTGSVRTKLRRLGATAQMGREWFTKRTLAEALHISVAKIQQWINCGWLKVRIVETGKLKKEVIDPDDFAAFCTQHRKEIIGPRLNVDRLEFVRLFVFPPSHQQLLPVRESKKERTAYQKRALSETVPAVSALDTN
jgi:hypothetical protein